MSIITLTTDFGIADEYVGAMKGSILTVNPRARLVDITHHVAPGDVAQGAHLLKAACGYYPPGTVHLAVVDPGVGTDRPMCALLAEDRLFVGPDNGLLTLAAPPERVAVAVSLEEERWFRKAVSRTFHGRDIFGPVAAHLSRGIPLRKLGPEIPPERLQPLARVPAPSADGGGISGTVIHVDRFGNLVTDIGRDLLAALLPPERWDDFLVRCREFEARGLVPTYGSVSPGTAVALIGSRDTLEIAVSGGNAAERLSLGRGDQVTVWKKELNGGPFTVKRAPCLSKERRDGGDGEPPKA